MVSIVFDYEKVLFSFLYFTQKMQTIILSKLKVTDFIVKLTFNQFD